MLKQIINQDDSSDASKPAEETAAAPKPRVSAPLSGMTGGKNILSSDVEIKGKLRFSNDLIIDGRIEGEVNSEGDLTVGENAQIVGDVKTRSVVVFGRIEGNITAGKLAIEEGATFMGSSTVGTPRSGNKAPAKPAGGQPTEGQ